MYDNSIFCRYPVEFDDEEKRGVFVVDDNNESANGTVIIAMMKALFNNCEYTIIRDDLPRVEDDMTPPPVKKDETEHLTKSQEDVLFEMMMSEWLTNDQADNSPQHYIPTPPPIPPVYYPHLEEISKLKQRVQRFYDTTIDGKSKNAYKVKILLKDGYVKIDHSLMVGPIPTRWRTSKCTYDFNSSGFVWGVELFLQFRKYLYTGTGCDSENIDKFDQICIHLELYDIRNELRMIKTQLENDKLDNEEAFGSLTDDYISEEDNADCGFPRTIH